MGVARAAHGEALQGGRDVRVYYSEAEPHESVLERGISWSRLAALGSVTAVLFGNAWNQLNQ
jgi:hypothetical protein